MSKNIKKIIAIAMAVGTVSAVLPVTNFDIFTTKAYASSDNDTNELDSLKLKTSDGSNIKLYSSSSYSSDDKVDSGDVKPDDKYYAKTSSDSINIDVDGVSSKYVRVFNSTSKSAKGKKISSDISLDSGSTTTLTIRIYSSEPDDDVKYSDEDDKLNDYIVKVKRTSDSSSSSDDSNDDDSDSYDDIYLDKLSINGDSISLSDSKTTYNYSVASDVDEATIKATPPDEDDDSYTVTIDGTSVDNDDKFKKSVDLKTGKNEIKVKLKNDDDEKRIYTLNITRGSSSSTSDSASTSNTTTATSKPDTATTASTAKVSQWVQVNGKWQYNDATGNPVKNSWVGNYYLQADATMATGWLNYSNSWYYLGTDGAKKTGWQLVEGQWYYLDTAEGRMQTGWIKDIDGKYYYLNSNGTMASNTTINGYKLGSNGAWIGK